MSKCLITYKDCKGDYSNDALKKLNKNLENIAPLDFTHTELRTEVLAMSDKISIQGIQPKLSARLNDCNIVKSVCVINNKIFKL